MEKSHTHAISVLLATSSLRRTLESSLRRPGHKFFAKTQVPLTTAVNVILCAFTRFRIDGKKQRKHPKKLDQIGDSHKKQSVGFKVS